MDTNPAIEAAGKQIEAPASPIIRTGRRGKPKGLKKSGGRKKGSRNKNAGEIQAFARKLLNDRAYLKELRKRVRDQTVDPGIHRMLYQYAFGRPPEKIELTGKDGGPIEQRVLFYVPKNGREKE